MSNDIRLNVGLDTTEALRKLRELESTSKDLNLNFGKGSKDLGGGQGIGEQTKIGPSNQGDDFLNRLSGIFEKTCRRLEDNSRETVSYLKDIKENLNPSTSTQPTKPATPTTPSPEKPAEDKNKKEPPTEQKSSLPFGNIAAGLAGAALALTRYASQQGYRAQQIESSSMNVFARTGAYESNFDQGRVDANKLGSRYGYGLGTTLETQDALLSSGGFKDLESLQADTSSMMKFAKVYGMDPRQASRMFGSQVATGSFSQGEGQSYSDFLSSTIRANNMVGREQEQVDAIQTLIDVVTDGFTTVGQDDVKRIASMQASLSKINENLKGDRGAQLLAQANSMFNANDPKMLRMVGYGNQLGYGADALWKAKGLLEEGFTNPETLKLVTDNMNNFFGGVDSQQSKFFIKQQTGLSNKQVDVVAELLKNREFEKVQSMLGEQGDTDELFDKMDKSKAMDQEKYDANKENAGASTGTFWNRITRPFKKGYNNLSPEGQVGFDLSSVAVKGTAGVLGLKSLFSLGPKMLSGQALSLPSLSLFGKGAGLKSLALGGGLKTVALNLSNKAPVLAAAGQGIEGTYKFLHGDTRGGTSAFGGAGGALAGAKLGAMAGTAIGGPVGTLIGGGVGALAGTLSGRWIAGKGYDHFSSKDNSKDSTEQFGGDKTSKGNELFKTQTVYAAEGKLLDRKDELLDKEEAIFDKVLGLSTNNTLPNNGTKDNDNIADILAKQGYSDKAISEYTSRYGGTSSSSAYTGSSYRPSTTSSSSTQPSYSGQFGAGTNAAKGDYLGKASSRFEAANAGVISSGVGDHGGVSYGLPQFSSTMGSAESFRDNAIMNSKFASYFENATTPNTKAFNDAWKQAYADDPDGFTQLQMNYNYKQAIEPFISKTLKKTGVDLSKTRALQEMAYSIATQHGSAGQYALGNINPNMSEEELINYVYDYKLANVGTHFKSSSKAVQNSIRNRIPNEKKEMLALLGQAPIIPSYAVGNRNIDRDKVAYLHKGETVLNKFDAADYRRGNKEGQGNSTINLNVNVSQNGQVDTQLMQTIQKAIEQAINQVQQKNNGIQLNRSFSRVPV